MSELPSRVWYSGKASQQAGMAELADAADSKSAEVHPSWGFDSPSRHQLNVRHYLGILKEVTGAFAEQIPRNF